uniref:Uncharacterized protein n=1 Tax=Oryza sativa subsp. japonica TaxID=39947 RepID=Q6EP79_ORYSJ|nr:hypothetical protein [Oryza sativa Japonica Group]BAD29541.1 hypothetical protein [Oryza sativa Japonica Group]
MGEFFTRERVWVLEWGHLISMGVGMGVTTDGEKGSVWLARRSWVAASNQGSCWEVGSIRQEPRHVAVTSGAHTSQILSGDVALSVLARLEFLMASAWGRSSPAPFSTFSPLANLKLLFLIDNSMYGAVPPSMGELYELYRLNL